MFNPHVDTPWILNDPSWEGFETWDDKQWQEAFPGYGRWMKQQMGLSDRTKKSSASNVRQMTGTQRKVARGKY